MQSQLAAALLGQGSNVAGEDDDKDEQDEEADEVDDFIDEECDGDIVQRHGRVNASNSATSRTVTLQMLLSAGILQPGLGTMSIEYLGQRFVGDLLSDGKIRSQETDIVFASPSAWAIACKRFINPDKKSGCGWASVKYRGKKLDAYKNIWYKKKKEEQLLDRLEDNSEEEAENEIIEFAKSMADYSLLPRVVVKHNTIANRTFTHDANTLIECVPFSNLGKIQPFLLSLSTNSALIMDFHAHLTKSEVSGYLAGHWDVNSHTLQVTHAFPCRNTRADREDAPQVEAEISKAIDKAQLTLVGWYHSHPFCAAAPTFRDIDAQLEYQIRMKGTSDNSYTPCIGIIVSPYNYDNTSLESHIIAYWVIPPPEAKPNEYGRPMLMSYSVVQDTVLPQTCMDEMKKCVDYYQPQQDFISFSDKFNVTTTYIEKLKTTLTSKFPRDQSETVLWTFIKELVGCVGEDKESPISIPSISKGSQLLSGLSSTSGLNSNLLLNPDIASLFFNSSKYPSTNTLLNIPDPMAQSTLAANNMFLSPNLFKMQDLLKPLSTSSPTIKSKNDSKVPLKIPSDLKGGKYEVPADLNLLSLKNKVDYLSSDFYLSKLSDFSASDLSISSVKTPKIDFLASDLSISSVKLPKSDYSLDLSKVIDFSSEPPSKIVKNDFSLDLSYLGSKNFTDGSEGDFSMSKAEDLSATHLMGLQSDSTL